MNPDKKKLILALSLAALALGLGYTWLKLEEARLLERGEELKVLAAKRYLPARTRLEPRDLAWLRLPRAYAPTGVVTEPEAVLGLQTLVPFSAEEPLLFNKLALGEASLAASVPEGRRAVSLPFSPVGALNGLLKPGDRVDVLLLHGQGPQGQAGLLLQDAPVLAVGGQLGRAEDEGRGPAAGPVTLGLSPADAALALAALAGGELHLMLRAPGDGRPSSAVRAGFADALRRQGQAAAAEAAAPVQDEGIDFIPRKR